MDITNLGLEKQKAELRAKMLAALANVTPTVRMAASIELCDRLKSQMPSANKILFYAPLADELDVWPLMEESIALGVICALPFFDAAKNIYGARHIQKPATEIISGKFGVREPSSACPEIPMDQFNLVLVPGMAFDLQGNRLGRGRGFYDRLLTGVSGIKCGVCYDGQLWPEIPTEPHDAKVDFIVTPSTLLRKKRIEASIPPVSFN